MNEKQLLKIIEDAFKQHGLVLANSEAQGSYGINLNEMIHFIFKLYGYEYAEHNERGAIFANRKDGTFISLAGGYIQEGAMQ